jgi:tRNA threonylcarbamoyladenosine biosynthesis protein TsaB
MPMLEELLAQCTTPFEEVDALAVSAGPGSFTGLRIGVSSVKGLAYAKNKPVYGVSTLEAMAYKLPGCSDLVVPIMDARRNQVYSATFRCDGEKLERLTEDRAIALSDLAEELKAYEGEAIYLSGDGYAVAKKALTDLGIKLCETPDLLILENAASVARVAMKKYDNGEVLTDSEIAPVYLRMPQAERERLEREATKKG